MRGQQVKVGTGLFIYGAGQLTWYVRVLVIRVEQCGQTIEIPIVYDADHGLDITGKGKLGVIAWAGAIVFYETDHLTLIECLKIIIQHVVANDLKSNFNMGVRIVGR